MQDPAAICCTALPRRISGLASTSAPMLSPWVWLHLHEPLAVACEGMLEASWLTAFSVLPQVLAAKGVQHEARGEMLLSFMTGKPSALAAQAASTAAGESLVGPPLWRKATCLAHVARSYHPQLSACSCTLFLVLWQRACKQSSSPLKLQLLPSLNADVHTILPARVHQFMFGVLPISDAAALLPAAIHAGVLPMSAMGGRGAFFPGGFGMQGNNSFDGGFDGGFSMGQGYGGPQFQPIPDSVRRARAQGRYY